MLYPFLFVALAGAVFALTGPSRSRRALPPAALAGLGLVVSAAPLIAVYGFERGDLWGRRGSVLALVPLVLALVVAVALRVAKTRRQALAAAPFAAALLVVGVNYASAASASTHGQFETRQQLANAAGRLRDRDQAPGRSCAKRARGVSSPPAFWFDQSADPASKGLQSLYYYSYSFSGPGDAEDRRRLSNAHGVARAAAIVFLCIEPTCSGAARAMRRAGYQIEQWPRQSCRRARSRSGSRRTRFAEPASQDAARRRRTSRPTSHGATRQHTADSRGSRGSGRLVTSNLFEIAARSSSSVRGNVRGRAATAPAPDPAPADRVDQDEAHGSPATPRPEHVERAAGKMVRDGDHRSSSRRSRPRRQMRASPSTATPDVDPVRNPRSLRASLSSQRYRAPRGSQPTHHPGARPDVEERSGLERVEFPRHRWRSAGLRTALHDVVQPRVAQRAGLSRARATAVCGADAPGRNTGTRPSKKPNLRPQPRHRSRRGSEANGLRHTGQESSTTSPLSSVLTAMSRHPPPGDARTTSCGFKPGQRR